MIFYKRNIESKLFSLRLLFLILATSCFLAFKYHQDNVGYFVSVILIMVSMIVVKDIVIYVDSFLVSKYYFFGLIKSTWNFKKEMTIKLSSFGSDYGENGESPMYDDPATELGCLFMIIAIFSPPAITMKAITIETIDTPVQRVVLALNKYEFDTVQKFIGQ